MKIDRDGVAPYDASQLIPSRICECLKGGGPGRSGLVIPAPASLGDAGLTLGRVYFVCSRVEIRLRQIVEQRGGRERMPHFEPVAGCTGDAPELECHRGKASLAPIYSDSGAADCRDGDANHVRVLVDSRALRRRARRVLRCGRRQRCAGERRERRVRVRERRDSRRIERRERRGGTACWSIRGQHGLGRLKRRIESRSKSHGGV